jgi:hypothetical protein
MRNVEFLTEKGWPLFMREFRVDNKDVNDNDNRYLECVLAKAVELDRESGMG